MNYREEVGKALTDAMRIDPQVLLLGEGVTDPKGIFGTTLQVAQQFPERVFETPLSENMITGACLGLALEGWKPILVHARVDFFMLAMEHMVNTAAKWPPVHHGKSVNMVIRGLVGRGWGQGPNHSQAFHAMLAHVPGLRVLYPVHPENVGRWYDDALGCGWPTIVMEPRRVYEIDSIGYPMYERPDLFIVTFGDAVLDATVVANQLGNAGVKAQVHPIEDVTAMAVPETDVPVVVVDTGHLFCGATAEVMARMVEQGNAKTRRVGPPFVPLPTSVALEAKWYPSVSDIMEAASSLLDIEPAVPQEAAGVRETFTGPF